MYYYNLGTLFQSVYTQHASRTALKYQDKTIDYATLAQSAERIALLLTQMQCRQGDIIAIAHTKHPLSYAAMLACLQLGLPYVVLDVAQPVSRLQNILQTAKPRLIFYDQEIYTEHLSILAHESACHLMLLKEDSLPEAQEDFKDILSQKTKAIDGATLAYIMFTSGSTGKPKGVAVTHQNVLHFIEWGKNFFKIEPTDCFANLSPMYFDNSVFDFYVGLFSGASIAPVKRELLTKPYELVAYVGASNCTIWFSVPSLLIYLMTMKALRKDILNHLRIIAFGGEGYPKIELHKLFKTFQDQAQIINVYGPTECTCISSAYILSQDDFTSLTGLPPLGLCNQNFDWYLEKKQEEEYGELILLGPNVSAGYYNDTQRTQAAFETLTIPNRYGKRAYHTGDLVTQKDGILYFQGRKDNQIKHMGYRIELEEIESGLMQLKGVQQAAVVYVRVNTAFGKLIAFVSYKGEEDSLSLLKELKNFLPEYMIPQKLMLLESLPKNANGKVDRQALRQQAEL
ncbi:MAG: AMP-binding protein [Desulfovibrionaceae bacterium]|nr:AMP-binding protein [Desulfovibrionaceae bacterium]